MRRLAATLLALLAAASARADAIVVTRAMTAETIAEVFVEPGLVRAELEVGVGDLRSFAGLLPEDLRQALQFDDEPSSHGWEIRADDVALEPRVVSAVVRPRIARDEITGEPLPVQPEDAKLTVYVVVEYDLPDEPAWLSVTPPRNPETGFVTADIGFVLYHEGLPVNDFRYLGGEEIVDLDWSDPWYSRFRNRNLRRQLNAPIQVFLYVEAYEVRLEVVARPRDLEPWLDLGLGDVIPAAEQPEILRRIGALLREHSVVEVDGTPVELILDRIHFLRRTLRTTGVIDPPEDLPAVAATVGAIFVAPVPTLPRQATVTWTLFSDRVTEVPAASVDEAGGLPTVLTSDLPVLEWRNFLKKPQSRELATIAPPPSRSLVGPTLAIACLLALGFAAWQRTRRAIVPACVLVAVAAVAWPLTRPSTMDDEAATPLLDGLLTNVYRAFDYRDETVIYDTLDRSVSGELLTDVYLETRRALELANQGGARARVKEVDVVETETSPLDGRAGFRTRCTWNVAGSVGHWGHVHIRRNRYEAMLTVEPIDGIWKLTGLELLSEERL